MKIGLMATSILELPMLNEIAVKSSKSLLSKEFRKQLEKLPPSITSIAQQKYLRWRSDYRSLNFEPKFKNIYVVEVTRLIHAICEVNGSTVYWLWIGKYDQYTSQLNVYRSRLGASK
jgi:hypothetical protein